MTPLCSAALAGSLALWACQLRAAPGDATRLEYARSMRAAQCPNREALQAAVRTRLGYDPFFPVARQTIVVEITDAPDGSVQAQMRLIDDAGMIVGSRELHESADHCDELIASLALAMSIALDPSAALGEEPAATPDMTAKTEADRKSEAADEPAKDSEDAGTKPAVSDLPRMEPISAQTRSTHSQPFLRGSTFASLGSSPSTAFGLRLGGGYGSSWFRVLGEVSAQLPTSQRAPSGGRVESRLYAGTVAPCVIAHALAACAVLQLGALHSRGRDVPNPAQEASFYGALGGRAEYMPLLVGNLHLVLAADLLKTFTPLTLRLLGESVWHTPFASFNAGAGLELRFP